MRKFLLLCCFALALPFIGLAQAPADTSRKIIQFSGLAVDADSLTPLPYVAIVIRHSERGVYSNLQGYYSIVVQENDTVDFFALGYHKTTFIVPDTFTTNQCVRIQGMRADTIYLRETVIYPWPTKEQFKNAFLTANVPDDDLARAYASLDPRVMAQLAASIPNDAGMAYTVSAQQRTNANYYAGQKPPNNLLNPIAWSRFIQSIQNGDLKGH